MDNKSPDAFRTISEVADWLGVPAHVLRFWESRFGQVKPVKRAGGRRYYRPSDMELLGGIRKLLHEDGMTIRGVQKLLRENGVRYVAAMSPPLDGSADLRDVTPDEGAPRDAKETAVDEIAPRADSVPEIADAADTAAAPEAVSQTADDSASAAPDTPAPTDEDDETGVADAMAPTEAEDAAGDAAMQDADVAASEGTAPPDRTAAPEVEVSDENAAAEVPEPPITRADVGVDNGEITSETAPPPLSVPIEAASPEAKADEDGDAPGDAGPDQGEPLSETAGPAPEDRPAPQVDETPEAMEFRAHEAQPETSEGPDEGWDDAVPTADEPTEAPAPQDDARDGPDFSGLPLPGLPQAIWPQDAAEDTPEDENENAPADSPADSSEDRGAVPEEALGEPDTPLTPVPATAEPDTGDAGTEEPEAAVEAPAADPSEHQEPEAEPEPEPIAAPRPDITMPAIGPDPEDHAARLTGPAVAATLRRHRPPAGRVTPVAGLSPALMQAYADRLQALAGRLGATPDGRRPF